jgi:hypothetical protein
MRLNTCIPEDLRVILDTHLWSDIEHRIPKGAYQKFICERIQEYFAQKALDVGEWAGAPKGSLVVRGSQSAIETIRSVLHNRLTEG